MMEQFGIDNTSRGEVAFGIVEGLFEIVEAELATDIVVGLGFEAQFLAEFVGRRRAAGAAVEQGLVQTRRREGVDVAAIDITGTFDLGVLISGRRIEGAEVEVVVEADAGAAFGQGLRGHTVQGDLLDVEAVGKVVGTRLEQAGAEDARCAVQGAAVDVKQGAELIVGVGQLEAHRLVVIAFQLVLGEAGGVGIGHPVVAALIERRQTEGEAVADRAGNGRFGIDGVERAPGHAAVTAEGI